MRKLIITLIILVKTTSNFAQKQIDKLTFEDPQNSSIFENIKNNTKILEYTSANGSILAVGDTLVIGTPSGNISNSKAIGA